jgi:hypothetical protein
VPDVPDGTIRWDFVRKFCHEVELFHLAADRAVAATLARHVYWPYMVAYAPGQVRRCVTSALSVCLSCLSVRPYAFVCVGLVPGLGGSAYHIITLHSPLAYISIAPCRGYSHVA